METHYNLSVPEFADAIPHFVWIADPEGGVVYVNRPFYEYSGLTQEQAQGMGWTQAIHPDDLASGLVTREAATEAGRTWQYECRLRRSDGVYRWHLARATALRDPDGRVTGWVGTATDIQARKEAGDRLRESEQRYRQIVEMAEEGIWIIDAQGRTTFANPKLARMLGCADPAEMQGTSMYDFMDDEGRRIAESNLQRRRDGVTEQHEFLFRRRDGSPLWTLVSTNPIADETGAFAGAVGMLTDITAIKEAQRELTEHARQQSSIADTLQQSLLQVPPPDTFPGITVKPLYRSAWDDAIVGGDFYDVFALEADRVALVIGDVTGKGLPAATYTAEIKFALRAFLREYPAPAIALSRLNQFVVDARRFDAAYLGATYVALAVVVVDTRNGDVISASAGMEPPLILRHDTGEAVELTAGGMLLGAQEREEYDCQRERMREGDLLAMTTDGIVEARADGDLFGYNGLVAALREFADQDSLARIGDALVERATAHAGGRQQDDICLLLVRRR